MDFLPHPLAVRVGSALHGVRAAEKTERESGKAFERERCIGFHSRCKPADWRRGSIAQARSSCAERDLPLKERFTVVDTASIPTPTPLRNPIRARAEKCLLTVRAREKSATCRWVLTEKMFEL